MRIICCTVLLTIQCLFQLSAVVACFALKNRNAPTTSAIKHLVVLMMENHSYDHFLGSHPGTDGTNSSMCNPSSDDDNDEPICVTHDGAFHTDEPENFIPDVDQQIYNVPFGTLPDKDDKPTMRGFVKNYLHYRDKDRAAEVMQGLNETSLPVLYKLVQEFAVSDRWFSSVPGSTFPNRNFLHAATSGGVVTNDIPTLGYPFKTTFEALDEMGVSNTVYSASPLPATMLFRYFRSPMRSSGSTMAQFFDDCEAGTLASYVFLEPAMYGYDQRMLNDQHPHAGAYYDLRRGEQLYKEVYEALRASPQWNETLFLLVWDEHGGFYDHVPPPTGVANPDGINDPTFDFTRLGIRVPAVLISPRIAKGVVLPRSHILEHASVPSTLHALFGMPHLTKRDADANTFHEFASLPMPRTDCVVHLPSPAWDLD